MTHAQALGLAAQAWCQPKTSQKIMDPDLAEAFACILETFSSSLERAMNEAFISTLQKEMESL